MSNDRRPNFKGRGSSIRPANRFESVRAVDDLEQVEHDTEWQESQQRVATTYLPDDSQSIVSENNSPDIPFRYSVNPYRGCQHGCSYCYARPTHEYLGLNAGIDFEAKILVKHRAPELLRDWLARPQWRPETIVFSGVTDCYQPAEQQYQLTRGCLEVALEARQPIGIVTKNALIARDLDILTELAKLRLISVAISVTTLDQQLARDLEPRTSAPQARLRAIRELADAGVPTSAMTAPIIPGLNDVEIPALLEAVAGAGATIANYTLLRLPLNVRPVFLDWLERTRSLSEGRVKSLIRATRDGDLSDSRFGARMRGEGPIAEQIKQTFLVFRKKFGLDTKFEPLDTTAFRRPRSSSGQQHLF